LAKKKPISVKGVEQVIAATNKFLQKSQKGSARGLRTWGEDTMTVAKQDFVPHRFGHLKGSGTVESKGAGTNEALVELSFGGESPAGEYAIIVHERPANHKHGTDKYLEKATAQESNKVDDLVARAVKRETGL
jgi:hypothetical protein